MTTGQFDFGQMWGNADMSGGGVRIAEGVYDAVCTKSEWGATNDGTKNQWRVTVQITTGQYAGTILDSNITISPVKNDGSPNPRGMGAMFRHVSAFGIPVPAGTHTQEGAWWTPPYNMSPEQVAYYMTGRPVQIVVRDDEYNGVTRSRIADFQRPREGAPTQVEQQQPAFQQQPQQGAFTGYAQGGQLPQGGGQPQQFNGGNGQPQPGFGGGGGYQAPGQPQGGPVAPGPWQNAQQPPQGTAPGAAPGAGGMGEFTAQGQSQQPWMNAQGQQGQQPPQASQQPPQQGQPAWQMPQGQPGFPPQGQPQGQPGYDAPGTGAPAQGAQNPMGAPSPSSPPWAQQGQPQMPGQQDAYQQATGQQQPQQPQQGGIPAMPWES